MKLNDKTYNTLKYLAQVFIPALTVFVGVVLECYHVESAAIIITIMTAFDAFLGKILMISSENYFEEKEDEE